MGEKKQFTAADVQLLLPDFQCAETDNGLGVRVQRSQEIGRYYERETVSSIPALMRAALLLGLAPDQFEDRSRYQDDRAMGSEWTGEYGDEWIHYDLIFLYDRPV